MPLPSSFWVDEMVTRFVVTEGAAHPSLAVAPQVPQSIYYALAGASTRVLGQTEVAYRLPSVLAMAGALWFLARLARRLIHPRAGWFMVFACLSLRGFNYQAADARPYALATLVAAAGTSALVKWMDEASWQTAALFTVCGAALWRVHLIDWPFYLVWGGYALWRVTRGSCRPGWGAAAAVFGLIGVTLAPVALNALALGREAQAHVITQAPRFGDLISALKPGLVVGALAGVALLARWRLWRAPEFSAPSAGVALMLGWWLIHPLALYAYSHLTGNSVFLNRYLSISLPGAALMATLVVALFLPPQHWRTGAAAFGAGVLIFMGQWQTPWPWHHNSDWRGAIEAANRVTVDGRTAVLCPSPFVEAQWPNWRPDYPLPGFLYAHLPVYPLRAHPYLLPYKTSAEAERFVGELVRTRLAGSNRFMILGGDRNVWFWSDWLHRCPELQGWSARKAGSFGDVELVIYQKQY